MNSYVIMTDTTADLPESYIREHGLSILSLNYILEGQTYDREHPLDVKEFYAKMRAGSITVAGSRRKRSEKKGCSRNGK